MSENRPSDLYIAVDYAYLRAFWHLNFFKPSKQQTAVIDRLPEKSAHFLTEIGLPKEFEQHLALTFAPFQGQFNLATYWDEPYIPLGQFLSKTGDIPDFLVLDIPNGQVFRLWPSVATKWVQFVNSSLEQFLICTIIYAHSVPSLQSIASVIDDDRWTSLTDDEVFAITDCIYKQTEFLIETTKDEMLRIDPRSFAEIKDSYFWPSLVYEWNR